MKNLKNKLYGDVFDKIEDEILVQFNKQIYKQVFWLIRGQIYETGIWEVFVNIQMKFDEKS